MSDEPPKWALDKAAKLAGYSCFQATKNKNNRTAIASTRAHAAALAKYETAPVDPVLLKAREIGAMFGEELNGILTSRYLSGEYDREPEMVALIAALRGDQ